jgi:hypothetical protein
VTASYLEFELPEPARFARLVTVFDRLKWAKEQDAWPEAASWLELFDEAAKATFWWPTPEEHAEHMRRWFATPVETRFTDPSLDTPWGFDSLIGAFEDGDYELLACRQVTDKLGRLEFDPYGWPFGGTGCMRALIEAFGGRVVAESGT